MNIKDKTIAVIGLGYVGLPLAVEFGKHRNTLGFDINQNRIDELKTGQDHTLECSSEELQNAIQANLLAATSRDEARNQAYNMAVGNRTTLKQLFALVRDNLVHFGVQATTVPESRDFRAGDVRHSLADTNKAQRLLGYEPIHRIADGVQSATRWYVDHQNLLQ